MDAIVPLPALRFADAAEGARFSRLHACFAGRAGEGWRRYPLRRIGNFVQQDWCRGDHSLHCAGGGFRSEPGDEWFELFTLHYDREWPAVFGLGVSAGRLPRADGWGVSFAYSRGGGRIVGDDLGVSFSRVAAGAIAQAVHLGDGYVFTVEETRIEVAAPGGADAELARLIASPESLRETGLARFDALAAEVERRVTAGEARKCVYGEYKNDGIPPVCTPTPLDAAETAAALGEAREEIAGRRAAIERHAPEFHAQLVALVEFDRCW